MKRASYRAAIYWLLKNDDCVWLDDEDVNAPSVAACLVADLFDVTDERVRRDLLSYRAKDQELDQALAT